MRVPFRRIMCFGIARYKSLLLIRNNNSITIPWWCWWVVYGLHMPAFRFPWWCLQCFWCSFLKVSYWFLMDSFGKDISWNVLQVYVFYVSLSLSLYTFSVDSLLYTDGWGAVALICYVLPMSCIHLLCGVPAHCLDSSMEFPQSVPREPYASLLG